MKTAESFSHHWRMETFQLWENRWQNFSEHLKNVNPPSLVFVEWLIFSV